jgi:hypothetical protein
MIQFRAGINEIKDLANRQAATRTALETISDLIDVRLFNPITNRYHVNPEGIQEVTPDTLFIDALLKAWCMLKCVPLMMDNIRCVID